MFPLVSPKPSAAGQTIGIISLNTALGTRVDRLAPTPNALPPETRIFVGHDYKAPGRDVFAWETTVAAERATNVQVNDAIDEAAFVVARKARDATLAAPRLLLPSLQVNIRGGRLPPPDADGTVRFRIPITVAQ